MIAKRCDRCGDFYEPYNTGRNVTKMNGVLVVNFDTSGGFSKLKGIDFCPKCKDEFGEWVNEGKDKDDE